MSSHLRAVSVSPVIIDLNTVTTTGQSLLNVYILLFKFLVELVLCMMELMFLFTNVFSIIE